jgi:hypothetical protein
VIQYRLRNKNKNVTIHHNPHLTNVRNSESNVTKEYKMNSIYEKAYIAGATIIALTIIYLSWGMDAPIGDFALCFGGVLLGHVLTEVFNFAEENE